jgi:site-specific DNA-cytosine methylase
MPGTPSQNKITQIPAHQFLVTKKELDTAEYQFIEAHYQTNATARTPNSKKQLRIRSSSLSKKPSPVESFSGTLGAAVKSTLQRKLACRKSLTRVSRPVSPALQADDANSGSRSRRKRPRIYYVEPCDLDFEEEPLPIDEPSSFEGSEIDILEDVDMSELDEAGESYEANVWLDSDHGPNHSAVNFQLQQTMELSDIEMSPARPKSGAKKTSIKQKSAKLGPSRRDLDLSLPPIENIRDIFSDITTKAIHAGLDRVVEHIKDRPLRVATMCSGTESPLLALKLVQHSLEEQLGKSIQIEHVFSAEIEPFKQAYIQRNFNPPLLFRDITEWAINEDGEMEGKTAYGAVVLVPRNIDILIVGSSCVDFSNLNSNKVTDLHARQGESADTFEAVRRYTAWASSPIVILENVIDARAWKGIEKEMQGIGYGTKVVKVDTKDFYLPHTRQRKYMLALNKTIYESKTQHLLNVWEERMESFRRRASAPISSFLLPGDDTRVLALLACEDLKAKDSFEQEARWEACRGRHLYERLKRQLGSRKPITALLPEHGYRKWLKGRVPRELDVIDICHLAQARDGLDSQYKTRIIDISQNVDRVDNAPLGISGCLTPTGTNYLTDWSRPVNGYECLILQGIPVDEVSFTSESDAELRNLAGNAMSSTIIGPAVLSAILVGFDRLPTYTPRKYLANPTTTLRGEDLLVLWAAQSKETPGFNFAQLLIDAEKSARRCYCEGQIFLSQYDILKCQGCSRTICEKCRGSPQHHFEVQCLTRQERLTPQEFVRKWSQHFPLTLQLDCELKLFLQQQDAVDEELRQSYLKSVTNAFTEHFTFKKLHRKAAAWSLCYESPNARLELTLSNAPEWQLFVKPSSTLAANSKLRQILKYPIARSFVIDINEWNFLVSKMDWLCFIPSTTTADLKVIGVGKEVESWRARIGLEAFSNEKVWDTIEIVPDATSTSLAALDIAGKYALIPDCGTACNSLYKRITASQGFEKDVFFFLDPDPVKPCSQDSFVFSSTCHRLEYGEARDVVAKIQSAWRPWNLKTSQPLSARIAGFMTPENVVLTAVKSDVQYHSVTSSMVNQDLGGLYSCFDVTAVLMVQFNANASVDDKWSTPTPISLDDRIFFDRFGRIFREAKDLVQYNQWTFFGDDVLFYRTCATCAPHPPVMRWMPDSKSRLAMHEDHLEAAKYEASMKSRPQPFMVKALSDNSNKVRVTIGVNFRTLAHRAIAQVRKTEGVRELTVAWNIDTYFIEPAVLTLPKFNDSLKGNDDSHSHKPTLRLRLPLHEQQLRSLTWMEEHEHGIAFPLQHVEEAILPSIGWKLEVRATATKRVKGGVLADQP